jgi:hypothetical protein
MTADREAFKATFCCCGKAEAERGRLPTWATQTSTTTLISTNSEVPLPLFLLLFYRYCSKIICLFTLLSSLDRKTEQTNPRDVLFWL